MRAAAYTILSFKSSYQQMICLSKIFKISDFFNIASPRLFATSMPVNTPPIVYYPYHTPGPSTLSHSKFSFICDVFQQRFSLSNENPYLPQ